MVVRLTRENQDVIAWFFTEHAFGPSGNQPPALPTITEPATNGQVVNPADVHMETSAFSDPDLGDQHQCTDFEIWTVQFSARIWATPCARGVEKLHTHLGDITGIEDPERKRKLRALGYID